MLENARGTSAAMWESAKYQKGVAFSSFHKCVEGFGSPNLAMVKSSLICCAAWHQQKRGFKQISSCGMSACGTSAASSKGKQHLTRHSHVGVCKQKKLDQHKDHWRQALRIGLPPDDAKTPQRRHARPLRIMLLLTDLLVFCLEAASTVRQGNHLANSHASCSSYIHCRIIVRSSLPYPSAWKRGATKRKLNVPLASHQLNLPTLRDHCHLHGIATRQIARGASAATWRSVQLCPKENSI